MSKYIPNLPRSGNHLVDAEDDAQDSDASQALDCGCKEGNCICDEND